MDLFRTEDLEPALLKQAQAFFDAYEQLPEKQRSGAVRQLATQVGCEFSTAFRWVHLLRPTALAEGGDWPYLEDDEDAPSKESAPVDLHEQAQEHTEQTLASESDEEAGSHTAEDIAYAASLDEDDLMAQFSDGIVKALRSGNVLRAEGRTFYVEPYDAYLAYLSPQKGPLLVPRSLHEQLLRAYSNWDGAPMKVQEIAKMAGMTQQEFRKYKSAFGWTRTSMPVTEPELAAMSEEEVLEHLTVMKESAVEKKWQKKVNRDERRDAKRWRQLKSAAFEHFEEVLQSFPAYEPETPKYPSVEQPKHRLILPLNDWQVGSFASEEGLRFGRQFDKDVFERMIEDYVYQLVRYLERNQTDWGTPIVPLLGDILHGMIGETMHGTKLAKHMREFDWEQARIAMDAIYRIMDAVVDFFGSAKVIPLPGNHEGAAVNILGEAISQRYRDCDVEVTRHTSRTHPEMVGNSFFLFDHGASPDSNVKGGKIARSGTKRDLQVKDLMMAYPEYLQQAKAQRGGLYFVMGDQHHAVDESMTHAEIVKLPALPSGDVYADENGWHSRPAQGVLLVDCESGLKHFERFYLDNERIFPS